MVVTWRDRRLIEALADGLPLAARPYAELGRMAGMDEDEVIERIQAMIAKGIITRFGVIVRHHELGYRANAMVVWDIPDDDVARVGEAMADFPFVTLCYRRVRRPPLWPYNLFCMIHGRERETVLEQVEQVARGCGLENARRDILFSLRRFKQRGAIYRRDWPALELAAGTGG
ncbi:MAG: AsnC family transcriptional regulator [Alphaproteobacteria bacterium]|nr:AsnC family transcriptional regulator [Alphaproteobacteria bacterium]